MKHTTTLFVAALFASPAFAQGGDDCSIPTAINTTGAFAFDTTLATTSAFNGGGSCAVGADTINQDLFWQFTVPVTGDYVFDTDGSSFDTKLSVHTGAACAATCTDYDDDGGIGLQSRISLTGLTAGDMLLIQAGGFGTASGFGTLNITQFIAPSNNDCSTPDTTTFTGLGTFAFDNTSASTSGFDGGGTCAVGSTTNNQDIFYTWTAPSAGDFIIDTFGTSFDTKLSVHDGADCLATCVGYNDDTNGLQSQVVVPGAAAGQTYLVQVGGFGTNSGAGIVNIALSPCINSVDDPLEDNDVCASPSVITQGLSTGLFCSLSDPDFYEITLQPDEQLTVTITDTGSEDIDLNLYDDQCALIQQYFADGFTFSTAGAAAPQAFRFEVFVNPNAAGLGCLNYDMDVVVVPDPCANPVDDSFEDNDVCTMPAAITSSFNAGLFCSLADPDFYEITLQPGELLDVTVFDTAAEDLDLRQFDDQCVLIQDFNTDGFSATNVGGAAPLTVRFEVYVDPLFSGMGCLNYDLDVAVSTDPCAGIMPDGFEDNDDCTTATPLGDGTYTGLNIIGDDNDFFSVSVADGATIQADIFFIDPDGDLDLYLWDPLVACDSSLVGEGAATGALSVGFSVSDDEFVTYTNTTGAAQDLIIEARKWSGDTANSCNTYDLQITGSAGPGGGGVGTNYCMANMNSTGGTASMGATGSRVAATNDVTLTAEGLPNQAFAFFLVSATTGFVPNPGGSEGNLCLGGAIGRYVGPGQIQQSNLMGQIALTLDLTQLPQPNGFVSVMSGETWNFQAWYRDAAMGGGATSNFTDGLAIDFL